MHKDDLNKPLNRLLIEIKLRTYKGNIKISAHLNI